MRTLEEIIRDILSNEDKEDSDPKNCVLSTSMSIGDDNKVNGQKVIKNK